MTVYGTTRYSMYVVNVSQVTKYLKPREASELLGVNVRTLARWENAGIIQAIKTPSGQRRYDVESYTLGFRVKKQTVLYCRVSSHAQKPDLNRQVAQLQALYSEARTIKLLKVKSVQ
ncbi:MerR family DNA-binding transcriptional regulator [Moorena sp. SIOASIH]|uniref:MerR family DNA-binding transcriptional regulator n=1 Tax=Moorena sp. SIOASIH TaxID=2607817 RepID=UPI0025D478D0|nr:MerR family DNA-binding transcriptional regulator [Moorena sp. SIOASIH]